MLSSILHVINQLMIAWQYIFEKLTIYQFSIILKKALCDFVKEHNILFHILINYNLFTLSRWLQLLTTIVDKTVALDIRNINIFKLINVEIRKAIIVRARPYFQYLKRNFQLCGKCLYTQKVQSKGHFLYLDGRILHKSKVVHKSPVLYEPRILVRGRERKGYGDLSMRQN